MYDSLVDTSRKRIKIQYFHETPGELFINPFYRNQYDFGEVKFFEAGKYVSPATNCFFLKIHNNKTFLLQPPPSPSTHFLKK